jgi:hypothetical protein
VRSQTGPVAGAEVTLGGRSARTDGNARTVMTAAPGKLEIHVANEGFLPATMSLSADQPEAYDIAIELEPAPPSRNR